MEAFNLQSDEVCKVRNSAVGRAGAGYSLAVIKRINRASIRVIVLDVKLMCADAYTVNVESLWKLKGKRRKLLEHKVREANKTKIVSHPVLTPFPPPLYGEVNDFMLDPVLGPEGRCSVNNLNCTFAIRLASGTVLYIAEGSVIDFFGDAIVNAANEGCIGGGGIDGAINDAGGDALFEARKQLPIVDGTLYTRCKTGDAKITTAGALNCKNVIHAVGPRFGVGDQHDDNLVLLESAYKSAMSRAREHKLKTVAFCILSAGIFRGMCPLKTVIKTGMDAIAKNAYPGLEKVFYCGFTVQEQKELREIVYDIGKDAV